MKSPGKMKGLMKQMGGMGNMGGLGDMMKGFKGLGGGKFPF
jgi:hypothetical protein